MGNNQQRSGQAVRETRRRRSFNPNSSRKIKASSVSPNSYKTENTIEKQSINTSGLNALNCQKASQNQRIDNVAKSKDQQQQQQSSKDNCGSRLNKSNSIIRSRSPNEQNKGSNEMILNKYLLKNEQCLNNNNPQSLLILSKYYDGSIIDQKTIKDISISHLNNTIRNDLSMDSSQTQDKNKRKKGLQNTSMSERLGIRRHSDNALAAAQQQNELSIKSRQWQPHNWKKQEELMNISEFMAEYRLFAGFFAGKEQTLAQTSIITLNMDLLEPFQEPPQENGEIRQTFGPQQRDLELQKYLQFLTDLESNSIEQMDYQQLVKDKRRQDQQFSSRLIGNNNEGFNALNKNKSMHLLQNQRQVEQTKQEQIQNYFLNQEISQQKDVSEILQKEFQRFEQSNQYVIAKQNASSLRELPQKEQIKGIGMNSQESQGQESEKLRDLNDLQRNLFDKSSQKLNENKYSQDPRQTVNTLGQDTQEQAVTQVEKDNLYQELMREDQLFENKSIEESKEIGSKEQIQDNTHDNQNNALANKQEFSNMSSIVMNDNSKQENMQKDSQIKIIPRQLAQPVRGQPFPSGRTFSERSLGKAQQEETINFSELESYQEKAVLTKQDDDDERLIQNQNSKLHQLKSAEFPQFSQSLSESNLLSNAAPFQNHFLPHFQYQNINKNQSSLFDPFQVTQVNQRSYNDQQNMPFRYLQQLEKQKQLAGKTTEKPLAGRKQMEAQVDDEIARKQMEIELLNKRIGIVKEANEEAARQRQERAQEKQNKSQTGKTPNQSCIINKTDKTLPSPRSTRNQNSQNLKGNASNNTSSKYKGVYMNQNQYSNQHKKKRELQVDSYSQMILPSQVPSEQSDNPQQNRSQNQEGRQIPLSVRTYQERIQENNKCNEFNDCDVEQSNQNEGLEESLDNITQHQQSQPIEVKMNLQDFRRSSKQKEEEVTASEVIPIEIDIKQFIKKRSSNATNDNTKTSNAIKDGIFSDNQRKAEIEEIGLKKLVSNRNNFESEGETILKSISRQVISLKGRIEKDKNILEQNRISHQNKIVTKAINTLVNSDQKREDRHCSLKQIPGLDAYEHPHFHSHQTSKQNIYQLQQQPSKQMNHFSSTKELTNQQTDSPTQFEQNPQGFETILENEDSQFSTIPSNYNPYFNTNNIQVTQLELSKDQQNIQTFPNEEDDNKRYPVTSKFEVAYETDHQLETQDSKDSMHFFETQSAQFSISQNQPFMDQNLQRNQPTPKNRSKDVISSSSSSLHDGFLLQSNQFEQKGIRNIPSNNSLQTSKRAFIPSVQNQQPSLQNISITKQHMDSLRQNQQSTSSLQSNRYIKDNGNTINSARSSDNKEYFNQVIQSKPNTNITYEENDDNNSAKDNQNRQINQSGDGFDFSAFDSVEQNEDHYTGSDVDSEDDNEPAKIKINLNMFKKK